MVLLFLCRSPKPCSIITKVSDCHETIYAKRQRISTNSPFDLRLINISCNEQFHTEMLYGKCAAVIPRPSGCGKVFRVGANAVTVWSAAWSKASYACDVWWWGIHRFSFRYVLSAHSLYILISLLLFITESAQANPNNAHKKHVLW